MRIADCGMRNKRREVSIPALEHLPIAAVIVLLIAALCLASTAHAELIDRIVASVNTDVITKSELDQAVGFNLAFGGKNDDKLRTETLEGLINRHLLMLEASRLKFVEVSDQDIDAEIEKLRNRLGSEEALNAFLARLGMNREQLGRMLGERLLVERFIEKKLGLYIRVSRDEAQEFFNRHSADFGGRRFPEVQKQIMAILTSRKLDQQVEQYLTDLKSKADIRINPQLPADTP